MNNKYLMDDKGNLSLNPAYKQPRRPVSNAKIIVDDLETKIKIMELSEKSGLSMKAIVIRLINAEYNKFLKDNEPI